MVNFKRKLLALTMVISVAGGSAFAQKDRDRDRRPPKGNNQVVVTPKGGGGDRPPSNNNNQGGNKPKGDKRGKP
jgi:hypothetical protein